MRLFNVYHRHARSGAWRSAHAAVTTAAIVFRAHAEHAAAGAKVKARRQKRRAR